jgi:hypothetical protein
VGAGADTAPPPTTPAFLALTEQQHLGHIARIFVMKANLKLADFTSKTERFHPEHNKSKT